MEKPTKNIDVVVALGCAFSFDSRHSTGCADRSDRGPMADQNAIMG